MNKDPFEMLSIIPDTHEYICSFIERNNKLKEIATKTTIFLDGFYSDSSLELLSSVDYILQTYGYNLSPEDILEHLKNWSNRKARLFSDLSYIEIARKHILSSGITR